jgi:hypothetical protein
MYNDKDYFVDNPMNRYAISDSTEKIQFNPDGSIDISIQHDKPRKDKESNWLPAPTGQFNLLLLLYSPQEVILKGKY